MRERADAWIWELAERQHGVVSRRQLLEQDLGPDAIRHRIAVGRLFPVHDGVYAVGRPQLDRLGVWSAAVLRCGPEAVLSHGTAAALWEIADEPVGALELSVPGRLERVGPGIRAHRRGAFLANSVTVHRGVPVTTLPQTLLDLARSVSPGRLEAAINAADRLGLADPEALRREIEAMRGRPGVVPLRRVLDRHDFVLTDSELERRFLSIARSAGLPLPATGVRLNGFKVDFFWPDLGLVVETDGLRYHRTPAAQTRDRLRDQAHTASGLTPLRFTHHQVRYQPGYVRTRLVQTVRHLRGQPVAAAP
jgi:very-short-patch-repair endonuclease